MAMNYETWQGDSKCNSAVLVLCCYSYVSSADVSGVIAI